MRPTALEPVTDSILRDAPLPRPDGKPHKVTVRDICNNAVDAYKELYKEYYQNVNH